MLFRVCASFLVAVGASLATVAPAAARPAQAAPVLYEPPVSAPVADPFRAPLTPYGPGNRGIEYDTEPGDPVHASAHGVVAFAGPVAGALHVTVQHADGVRTSYSHLRSIEVAPGRPVQRGDRIGRAGETLHLGARVGPHYIDPAGLFAGVGSRVELLPLDDPPGHRPGDDRAALSDRVWGEMSPEGWEAHLPPPPDVDEAGALAASLARRARLVQHYRHEVDPMARGMEVSHDIAERLASPPPCTDDPPPQRPAAAATPAPAGGASRSGPRPLRHAILVGGLGSSSRSASIDDLRTDELGYGEEDVERFSYAGPGRPYTSADTQGDLRVSATRLADAVEEAARASPGATIDVYAHSMGGVVTRLALLILRDRGFDLDHYVGLVATLGSPHRGADLATAALAAGTTPPGRQGLDVGEELLDTGLDPRSPAVTQLAETSDVMRLLDEAGIPPGVDLVSVAASGDVVVPLPNTRVEGGPEVRNVTVSLTGREAHGDLVGTEEATAEIARALAGEPQGCESAEEVVEEHLLGHGISYIEDATGFVALGGAR